MKYLIAVLTFLSCSAIADDCVNLVMRSSITAEQKAKLVQECPSSQNGKTETMLENVTNMAPDVLEKASEVSVTVAQTIKLVATELNVAANEFVETPVGKIVAVLVILHFAGDYAQDTLAFVWNVVIGLFIMIIGCVVSSHIRSAILRGNPTEVKYTNIFGKERTKRVENRIHLDNIKQLGLSDDAVTGIQIGVMASYVLLLVSIVVGLNFMVPG